MPEVTVYSTKNCPYCRMAKAFLDRAGVKYRSVDVGDDPKEAAEMIALSGQQGVPVITVGKEVIVGFDAQRLGKIFGVEKKVDIYDVLIVGAGPAGLTAALYCSRKLLTAIIVSENIGGQALESGDRELHGIPGGHGWGPHDEIRAAGPGAPHRART